MGRRKSKQQATQKVSFWNAIKHQDTNSIQQYFESEDDTRKWLELTDQDGNTPLHLAAGNGALEIMELLITHGALEEGRKSYAKTPLHEAAIHKQLKAAELLIEHGVLVDCHTTRGRTPLMYAARNGDCEMIKLFYNRHANINEQNQTGITPLYEAAREGHAETVRLLLLLGASVELGSHIRHTPLHVAVAEKHEQVVKVLLEHDAPINVADSTGVTVYHEAAGAGNVAILKLLLNKSPPQDNLQEDNVMSRQPFHYAAIQGHADYVREMIKLKLAPVDLQDTDGCTALYYASANGHADVLETLLVHGANPNLNSQRRSPLHCATEWERLECVKILLKHGAAKDSLDQKGRTPKDIAEERHYTLILEELTR